MLYEVWELSGDKEKMLCDGLGIREATEMQAECYRWRPADVDADYEIR